MNERLFIGIDDTDNLQSRGTGFHARSMGAAINENKMGQCRFITRHQLLMSPLVPFTSHNSAACLVVDNPVAPLEEIENYCIDYLISNSADGADAGLCLAFQNQLSMGSFQYGVICKHRLVDQAFAMQLAKAHQLKLHGLTGTHDGLIGALAAVNLCGSGNDGRLLWLAGMRDHVEQCLSLKQLYDATDITVVQSQHGQVLTDPNCKIHMGAWPRTIWMGGEACLIVEPYEENPDEWQVAAKNYLKQF